ncbi:MAG TPA: anthranilate phosphoribosyltransferase [Methanolinea sp.]|nr:anthranilate phosphoribosyltransferase [Methanolinea sp.]
MMQAVLQVLSEGRLLSDPEAREAMEYIASGRATDAQMGAFLAALRIRGENAEEIATFGRVLQHYAVTIRPRVAGTLVDTCGTGGDGCRTFNISTAAAIVAAGAGVVIVKHGNRSVSSSCGSADVLEALGVKIDIQPERVCRIVEETGIGFLFAPAFHPAFRNAARVRKDLGFHTVFNMLGPLLNPAGAQSRLMGVYSPAFLRTLAESLQLMGAERAMVVHGSGLDEITTTGPTQVAELAGGTIREYTFTPGEFGIPVSSGNALRGGTPAENAAVVLRILEGGEGPGRDVVVMNAGAAIYLAGKADDLAEGITLAKESIRTGAALGKLEALVTASGRAS